MSHKVDTTIKLDKGGVDINEVEVDGECHVR
jgi:hypothetical protein